MDCREALTLATEALNDDVPNADGGWRKHVAACASCRVELERAVVVWGALSDPAGAIVVSDDLVRRVEGAMAERFDKRRAPMRRWWGRAQTFAWAGGALVLAAGVLLVVFRPVVPVAPGVPAVASKPPVRDSRPGGSGGATSTLPPSLAAYVADDLATDGQKGRAIAFIGARYGDAVVPSELVTALARTLKTDRNPGVRRRAAQALAGLPPTREICDAFLAALRSDRNPAVRGIAVEALGRAARRLDEPSIEGLRERAADVDENEHLRVKAANTLRTIAL